MVDSESKKVSFSVGDLAKMADLTDLVNSAKFRLEGFDR